MRAITLLRGFVVCTLISRKIIRTFVFLRQILQPAFFTGMICFAWNNANDNVSGMSRDRRDMEIAGTMGIMSILTGILYMVDFFYTMYQNALHGPANTY